MTKITFEYVPTHSDVGYTKVHNGIFADDTASMAERGMYMLLTELQGFVKNGKSWELSAKGLACILNESEKTVRRLFTVLQEKGYLSMKRKKTKGSFFGGNQWEIHDKTTMVEHYTMVDNSIFRENLSLKQIGLIGTLLCLHEAQPATIRALDKMLPDSYGSIHARRKELEQLGFFHYYQENQGSYGQSVWKVNRISDKEQKRLQRKYQESLKEFMQNYGQLIRKIVKRKLKTMNRAGNFAKNGLTRMKDKIGSITAGMGELCQSCNTKKEKLIHEVFERLYRQGTKRELEDSG